MEKNLVIFQSQIKEDIDLIKDEFKSHHRYNDDNFVFNHWILDKIYMIDGEVMEDNIIDQSGDREIDCYVNYPDHKELYLIQNKYYSTSSIKVNQLSKFLIEPLSVLNQGKHPNTKLQKIYNQAKENNYKIYLYLYTTENKLDESLRNHIKEFNKKEQPYINADIFDLSSIFDLYYKEYFHGKTDEFNYEIKNIHENHMLKLSNLKDFWDNKLKEGYYVAIPIAEIYNLYKEAKKSDYNIFDDNIREYLGNSSINGEIIKTLKCQKERKNFFYYNNGITLTSRSKVIVSDADNKKKYQDKRTIQLSNPQIINGCQTVNAIYSVLNNDDNLDDFKETYVLLKILDFKTGDESEDTLLHEKIVECTNTQNAIKPSDFTKNKDYFTSIQNELFNRGVLLEVKRSDKHKFSQLSKNEKSKLLNTFKNKYLDDKSTLKNSFSLEKMLLVYLSIIRDGYTAYTKKKDILKPKSEILENVSMNLNRLNHDNLIRMYIMFLRAEEDKRKNLDKKYIPYYMFSFIGDSLNRNHEDFDYRLNFFFEEIFKDADLYESVYKYFKILSDGYYTEYKKKEGIEYNQMIKKEINPLIKKDADNNIRTYGDTKMIKATDELFEKIKNKKFY